jgi:hypothetical protein
MHAAIAIRHAAWKCVACAGRVRADPIVLAGDRYL